MQLSAIEFCQRLAQDNPALGQSLKEHLIDNYGQVLPHIFLADVYRKIRDSKEYAPSILRYLNRAFTSSGKEVNDLIAVGFVETIDDFDEIESVADWGDYCHLKDEWLRQRDGED